MKIQSITTAQLSVPLKRPFKTALRTCREVQSVLVRVQTEDGRTGYGEAPPTAAITGETIASIQGAVQGHIAPALQGMRIDELDNAMKELHGCIVHNTSAKAAVDMALYDLFAQQCGLPLYRVLGGHCSALETDITVSLNSPEQMAADSLAALEDGYRIIKIKVGRGGQDDWARISAIHKVVGGKALLRIDANQGWTAKESVRLLRRLEDAGIEIDLVEQPVAAHDIEGLRFVTQNVATPVLADESVFSVADALHIIQTKAADLINIKLMKTGGIHKALALCAIAEEYGVECMMGCMLESGLAVSAAAHFAAARGIITRIDLDGPTLCAENPFQGGPEFAGSSIVLNETPGLGFTFVPGFEK